MNPNNHSDCFDDRNLSKSSTNTTGSQLERLLTLKAAAEELNLPAFKITRAASAGIIPTYSLYNKRKLVRLSEVVAAINASKQGGSNG
jgi:hypothetical protein